jgi:hypothetical protein
MKINFISFFLFINFIIPLQSQNFKDYFTNNACRADFQLSGNKSETKAYLVNIKQEPYWGGRRSQLATDMNLGQYRFQIIDSTTNKLLYTDGFSTLYYEWQTTNEAESVNKSFEQTIQFPFPLKSIIVRIEKRTDFEAWEPLLIFNMSPDDKLIKKSQPQKIAVKEIFKNKSSDQAIDIAIIAEGYTFAEQEKFFADAQKIGNQITSHQPFTKYKKRINIYAVGAISEESGISMPQNDDWKNTAVGSHFHTFYASRYLTTPDVFKLRDLAASVPYDAIMILANTTTYGGGGIYNFYAVASADSRKAQREVVVHEFGHSFAGLGDEYFKEIPDVLDDMYDLTKEPWEPNITSLVSFDKKWKKDLDSDAEIPTPVNEKTKKQKIGVFEGGGYMTKGMYRPAYDCRMRTNEAKSFCAVCEKSVERVIMHLTEK